MQYNNRFYCGCALINDRYVLTAAHCVTGFQARRISVVLLDHNRSKPDETVTITRKVGIDFVFVRLRLVTDTMLGSFI